MKKILLIEDEKILAEMYQDKLTKTCFEVYIATEPKEALVIVKKKKPDLIVLDILLPKENGIYFLQRLRRIRNKKIASIPVVAFSNFDDPKTKQQAQKLGIEDYLIKTNYTPKQLVDKIKYYLGKNN